MQRCVNVAKQPADTGLACPVGAHNFHQNSYPDTRDNEKTDGYSKYMSKSETKIIQNLFIHTSERSPFLRCARAMLSSQVRLSSGVLA